MCKPKTGRGNDFGGKTEQQLINDIVEIHGYGDDVKSPNNWPIDLQTSYMMEINSTKVKVRSDENCYHCRPNHISRFICIH